MEFAEGGDPACLLCANMHIRNADRTDLEIEVFSDGFVRLVTYEKGNKIELGRPDVLTETPRLVLITAMEQLGYTRLIPQDLGDDDDDTQN